MEITAMKRHSFSSQSARRALGVAGIAGFVALALCFDGSVLTRFQIMNTAKAEDSSIGSLQRGNYPSLADEGAMPELDGAALGENHGVDTAPDGTGEIWEPRLYRLIRQKGPIVDRTFEIEFLDPGVQARDFTFGQRLHGARFLTTLVDHNGSNEMNQLRRYP
jgi:hypothetical protein